MKKMLAFALAMAMVLSFFSFAAAEDVAQVIEQAQTMTLEELFKKAIEESNGKDFYAVGNSSRGKSALPLFVEELQKIDPDHAQTYRDNTTAYLDRLNKLDDRYRDVVAQGSVKTLLFGDRFPFRYLVDDYGLSYYAAFVGCSAETEASFETITFLAGKLDELSLPAILTIEGPDHRIAETVVQAAANKDLPILTMDSMQSTTAKDVENGTTYLSVMENNLSVLTEALK